MAIRVDLLRRMTKLTAWAVATKKKRGHGGQQGQHRRRNKNVRRPKGYAPLPAYEEKGAESAAPRFWSGQALLQRPQGA